MRVEVGIVVAAARGPVGPAVPQSRTPLHTVSQKPTPESPFEGGVAATFMALEWSDGPGPSYLPHSCALILRPTHDSQRDVARIGPCKGVARSSDLDD